MSDEVEAIRETESRAVSDQLEQDAETSRMENMTENLGASISDSGSDYFDATAANDVEPIRNEGDRCPDHSSTTDDVDVQNQEREEKENIPDMYQQLNLDDSSDNNSLNEEDRKGKEADLGNFPDFLLDEGPPIQPFAGAPRSLVIKVLPDSGNTSLSEWIRPASAQNGVSGWDGTPPSSPMGISPISLFRNRQLKRDSILPTKSSGQQDTDPNKSPESPVKGRVNYSLIYQRFEDIFVRFLSEEEKPGKLSRPNSALHGENGRGKEQKKKAKTARKPEDYLDFFCKYASSLSAWLGSSSTLGQENGPSSQNGFSLSPFPHSVYKLDCDGHDEVYQLVTKALREVGTWHKDRAENAEIPQWNLLWSWSSKTKVDYQSLNAWQRVNHYPCANQLTRKDTLNKNLNRCKFIFSSKKKQSSLFDVMPLTYSLPQVCMELPLPRSIHLKPLRHRSTCNFATLSVKTSSSMTAALTVPKSSLTSTIPGL